MAGNQGGEVMYTLSNDSLIVSILDPVADRRRLGPRYCTGCSIRQVADVSKGDLFPARSIRVNRSLFMGRGAGCI